jgi:hypothetical protein
VTITPNPATSNREETSTLTTPVISLGGRAYRSAIPITAAGGADREGSGATLHAEPL